MCPHVGRTGLSPAFDGWHSPMALSPAQVARFNEDGFILVRRLFNNREISLLSAVARADPEVTEAKHSSTKQIKLWGNFGGGSVVDVKSRVGVGLWKKEEAKRTLLSVSKLSASLRFVKKRQITYLNQFFSIQLQSHCLTHEAQSGSFHHSSPLSQQIHHDSLSPHNIFPSTGPMKAIRPPIESP